MVLQTHILFGQCFKLLGNASIYQLRLLQMYPFLSSNFRMTEKPMNTIVQDLKLEF